MLLKWLEPSINRKIDEINASNCEISEIDKAYHEFDEVVQKARRMMSDQLFLEIVLELEARMANVVYWNVDNAYKNGLVDGIALNSDMQTLMNAKSVQ